MQHKITVKLRGFMCMSHKHQDNESLLYQVENDSQILVIER